MPNVTPNYNFNLPLVNDPTDQDLWGGYLNTNFSSLDTLIYTINQAIATISAFPAGAMTGFGGATAPAGWLFCYGQAVSRTTYATLFTAIGTGFGAGDGSTTFNLPDMRGRVMAGKDDMGGSAANRITTGGSGISGVTLGAVGGPEVVVLDNTQIPSHTHSGTTSTDPGHTHTESSDILCISHNTGGGQPTNSPGSGQTNNPLTTNTAGSHSHTFTTNATGGGLQHSNVQPTIITNTIIKT